MDIFQYIIYGIIEGANYGLVAIGLALVMGVMGIFNLAHGCLAMIAAYVSFWLFRLCGLDPFLSIPISMILFFLIGIILYKVLFSSVAQYPPNQKLRNSLLISFGLLLVLENLATVLWTANVRSVSTFYSGMTINFFDLYLPYIGLFAIILSIIIIFSVHWFLTHTLYGKAISAIAKDYECAKLMGINVDRAMLIAFGIGISITAVVGAIISLDSVSPAIGVKWVNKALVVVVLAGVGSVSGIFFAGMLLGVVESISVYFVGTPYTGVVGLVMFLLVLMFRPQGLFGKKD